MFNATLWFVAFVEGGFVLQFALSVRRLLAIVMEKYISAWCKLEADCSSFCQLYVFFFYQSKCFEEASLPIHSYLWEQIYVSCETFRTSSEKVQFTCQPEYIYYSTHAIVLKLYLLCLFLLALRVMLCLEKFWTFFPLLSSPFCLVNTKFPFHSLIFCLEK